MSKRTKVMNICMDGFHIECIRINDKNEYNPFRVYRVTQEHRRQIAKYGDFMSVIHFIWQIYRDGLDVVPLHELLEWAKETGSIW